MARSKYDDLHDQIDPIATKKSGTRYERLVAYARKALDESAGVSHDLKLIGEDTDVKHQIDVTITRDGASRRTLIECKDFDVSGDKVGLGIVRDFFGVVDDVKPDEAVVITCNGFTKDAMKYAKGKNIKLAILRTHRDEDDDGTITKVAVTMEISMPHEYRATITFADREGLEAAAKLQQSDVTELDRRAPVYLHRKGRESVQLLIGLTELFNDKEYSVDEGLEDGSYKKTIKISDSHIQYGEGELIAINGFFVGYKLATETRHFVVERPFVSLILKPIGDDADLLIFEKDLKRFHIDPESGDVLPR